MKIHLNDQQKSYVDQLVSSGLYGATREDAIKRVLDERLLVLLQQEFLRHHDARRGGYKK